MALSLTRKADQGVEIVTGQVVTTIRFDRNVGVEITAPASVRIFPIDEQGNRDKKPRFRK